MLRPVTEYVIAVSPVVDKVTVGQADVFSKVKSIIRSHKLDPSVNANSILILKLLVISNPDVAKLPIVKPVALFDKLVMLANLTTVLREESSTIILVPFTLLESV